jgi:tyrosyl-tRNA synthetase
MNAMVPGLAGGKMSSSDPNSKIDFLDPPAVVRKKIKAAFCEEGNIEDNGLLAFAKAVLIPVAKLKGTQGVLFSVMRDDKYGGPLHYEDYETLEKDFADKGIHPGDLKKAVGDAIIALLEPIQKDYEENKDWKEVTAKAYPVEVKPEGKKKVKVRGDLLSNGT